MHSGARRDGHASARLQRRAALCALTLVQAATSGAFRVDHDSNLTSSLRAERQRAEALWRRGEGLLWFQHYRRAGGTSLCQLLRDVPQAQFLLARGEACQPEDWKLRDAVAVCEHNLTLVGQELRVQDGNAFAQEYGSIPGRDLAGHRSRRYRLRHWVFVATMREPWSRFWSQVRYEMATCLADPSAMTACIGGNFEALGYWWSPTAHPDTILGVPGERTWESPRLYVDNYYTRVLLNKTDFKEWPRLQASDMYKSLDLLRERFSGVIIAEDFRRSALQLACALDLDVAKARAKLGVVIRPYMEHANLMEVPDDERRLGVENMKSLRSTFVRRNAYDYALYAEAKRLSKRRVAACARHRPDVRELYLNPPPLVEPPRAPPVKAGDPVQPQASVDDLFGCTGGSLEWDDEAQQYNLLCPRTAEQHAASWWSSKNNNGPKRKKGHRAIGWDCWSAGFTWATCCADNFGPKGNVECWDKEFTHRRCCFAE